MNFVNEEVIRVGELKIVNYLPKKGIDSARKEIIDGLLAPQKYISPKYFYDKTGSELFEEITRLDEYYPTRSEMEILSSLIKKLDLDLNKLDIIELGSGDSSKIRTLASQIPKQILSSINYYPVDISQSAIEKSVEDLIRDFSFNNITGIVTDFLHSFAYMPRRNKRMFCFLGSTIGNLSPVEVEDFMREISRVMDEGDVLLLGADMIKDVAVLEAAYNDSKGVTARFNRNILKVVNGHIHSNFNPWDFEHLAFYNHEQQRIEMHLRARKDLNIDILAYNRSINFRKGETIHSENSYKFSLDQLEEMGNYGGLNIENVYSDSKGWFNLVYYVKASEDNLK